MDYAIIALGGLVMGFLVPPSPRSVIATLGLGACYVVAAGAFAVLGHGSDVGSAMSYFVFPDTVPELQPGVGVLVVVADAVLFSAVVVFARFLVRRVRAGSRLTADGSYDDAA